MPGLTELGWNETWEPMAKEHRAQGFSIARVTEEHRGAYIIRGEQYEVQAEVSGRLMFQANDRFDYPAVGDWVAVTTYDDDSHATIHAMLPRKSVLQRKTPGKKLESQIIAANIDYVFIVQSLDQSFNPRRVERFLVVTRESGARPVVLLSKKDLCPSDELSGKQAEIAGFSEGVTVISYSIFDDGDIRLIQELVNPGTTFCLIGASGVGKSTLINRLAGREILATGEVREYDAKGRHTTNHRELIVLEHGGILIDTPGIRELGIWQISTGLEDTFDDIAELAQDCYFTDCTHTHEPGCAVKKAIDEGRIDGARYESYVKLLREQKYQQERQSSTGVMKRRLQERKRSKELKKILRRKGKK